jgi:CMP-N-acetylneuraminic acid synthetase
VIVTSDAYVRDQLEWGCNADRYLHAPAPLHQDETPMIDVVRDVLERCEGDTWALLQPTQPLREPKHVQAAIALLEDSKADSVVSIVEIPQTHHPLWQCEIVAGRLVGPWLEQHDVPVWRQALQRQFIRDGTCYAFKRSTVTQYGNIYGLDVSPLIIDPSETCPLDSPQDWVDAERRLREREG